MPRVLIALLLLALSTPVFAADHIINSGDSIVDCDTFDGGVNPGDTLTFAGTSRSSKIELQDCHGTAGNPITLRNDVTQSSAFTITGGSGFVIRLDDSSYLTIDGTGKWVGASSSGCGAKFDGQTQNCGIIITTDSGCATGLIKLQDEHNNLTIRGVESFGNFPFCVSGIGWQMHDNNSTNAEFPGSFYEDNLYEDNYIHDVSRTAMYIGSNMFGTTNGERALTQRNNEIRYNLIEDTGCDGIKLKSYKEGLTLVHHNIVRRSGQNPEVGSETGCNSHAFTAFESGFITFYNNLAEDTVGLGGGSSNCYSNFVQKADATIDGAVFTNTYYNNIGINCKGTGISVGNQGDAGETANQIIAYNNTLINNNNGGIRTTGGDGDSTVQDNIVCDNTGGDISTAVGDTVSSNQTGSCASQNFVNLAARDLHLTTSSPAKDAGGVYVSPPDDDFDGVNRPLGVDFDDGAYEFVEAGGPGTGDELQSPKPSPFVIDSGETHYPDYLWLMDEASGGTVEDNGSAVDCDLSITGADWNSDSFGNYLTFISANSDEAINTSCTSPITTTSTLCSITRISTNPGDPVVVAGWFDASDADQGAHITLTGNGTPSARVVQSGAGGSDVNNAGAEIDDDLWHMVCVRQSDTTNDVSVDGAAWDVSTISLTGVFTGTDTISVGSRHRLATDHFLDGNVMAVFGYDGSKTSAEISTIWGAGNPWPQIGVDPASGPPPVTQRNQFNRAGSVSQ